MMTVRPRQLRAVIAARGRLRDLAGVAHANAAAAEQEAADAASTAAAELEQSLATARDRMASSSGVTDLMRIADELAADRAQAAAAEKAREAANARARASAAALRQRERELRTVERVLEDSRERLAAMAEKGEQRATDDRTRGKKDDA